MECRRPARRGLQEGRGRGRGAWWCKAAVLRADGGDFDSSRKYARVSPQTVNCRVRGYILRKVQSGEFPATATLSAG